MGILAPLALALLALALPIIALYLLRPRRPAAPVSSLLLWQAALTDVEANAPWQRLRRNWLLLLQLAILALLALASARPVFSAGGATTGNLIVVLDGSASMRATDVTPNRFERARASVRSLAALEPELAVTGHGRAVHGQQFRDALHLLADQFDDIAVPRHGRYVRDRQHEDRHPEE